jgi:hypothetical protein
VGWTRPTWPNRPAHLAREAGVNPFPEFSPLLTPTHSHSQTPPGDSPRSPDALPRLLPAGCRSTSAPPFALWEWIPSDLHHLAIRFAWRHPRWLSLPLPVARVSVCWRRPAPVLLRSAPGGGTSVMVASAYSCWRGPVRVVLWRPHVTTACMVPTPPASTHRCVVASPLRRSPTVLRELVTLLSVEVYKWIA